MLLRPAIISDQVKHGTMRIRSSEARVLASPEQESFEIHNPLLGAADRV
jgi:hypothetical protein